MANRVNRAIELLDQGQPIYYSGAHTGHVLTREQGIKDAAIWSDYINVGMEHGSFDLGGLESYMQGMAEGGPTASGHRTPTVIVEAPVEGTSAEIVRYNAWQFRQILARGVHGILLCQAETPEAVAAFVEACRYPINSIGVGAGLKAGRRGVGSEPSAAAIWGVDYATYLDAADPWPLNPEGELLLGLKIESAAALPRIEEIFCRPRNRICRDGAGRPEHLFGLSATSAADAAGDARSKRTRAGGLPGQRRRLSTACKCGKYHSKNRRRCACLRRPRPGGGPHRPRLH